MISTSPNSSQITTLILHSILDANKNEKQPIKIGDITIPADKESFNRMWLAKAFDDIDPSHRLKINLLSLMVTLELLIK